MHPLAPCKFRLASKAQARLQGGSGHDGTSTAPLAFDAWLSDLASVGSARETSSPALIEQLRQMSQHPRATSDAPPLLGAMVSATRSRLETETVQTCLRAMRGPGIPDADRCFAADLVSRLVDIAGASRPLSTVLDGPPEAAAPQDAATFVENLCLRAFLGHVALPDSPEATLAEAARLMRDAALFACAERNDPWPQFWVHVNAAPLSAVCDVGAKLHEPEQTRHATVLLSRAAALLWRTLPATDASYAERESELRADLRATATAHLRGGQPTAPTVPWENSAAALHRSIARLTQHLLKEPLDETPAASITPAEIRAHAPSWLAALGSVLPEAPSRF